MISWNGSTDLNYHKFAWLDLLNLHYKRSNLVRKAWCPSAKKGSGARHHGFQSQRLKYLFQVLSLSLSQVIYTSGEYVLSDALGRAISVRRHLKESNDLHESIDNSVNWLQLIVEGDVKRKSTHTHVRTHAHIHKYSRYKNALKWSRGSPTSKTCSSCKSRKTENLKYENANIA